MNQQTETRVTRIPNAGRHRLSLLKHIYVEWGDKSDWDKLCELHYKGHSLAAGSKFMRCVYSHDGIDETIGVMVFANPMPLNKGRHEVFPEMKPNQRGGSDTKLMNQRRMGWINRNLAWNNRTVLDTMYRSAGIAYRFKNLAYRMYGKRFVESNSSMGKFNPFSLKSGMRMHKPKPNAASEVGIAFFRSYFEAHPCDQSAIMAEINAMSAGQRKFVERKLREFYQAHSAMEQSGDKMHSGMERVNQLPIDYILRQTVQIVFGQTIYWVFENPDHGRELPRRLPLLAFDNQPANAPLDLEAAMGMMQ